MPNRLESLKFEHQLFERMERLSNLHDTLPPHPLKPRVPPLAHIHLDSNKQLPPVSTKSDPDDLTPTSRHLIRCDSGDVWIQGNTLLCSCPDCRAPMTIRIWLQLADCWRCQSSIALTEEQVAAIEKLTTPAAAPEIPKPKPSARYRQPRVSTQLDQIPAPVPSIVNPLRQGADTDPRRRELEQLARGSWAARTIRRGFNFTPAWLVSFFLHLLAILILALIVFGDRELPEKIDLSTFVDAAEEEGGVFRIENPLDLLQDDLELASKMQAGETELRDVLKKANQDAREIVDDPRPLTNRPDITFVKRNITTRPDQMMSFSARDPRVRAEMVEKEGGTLITEAAVARGLRWLASVQNQDGSWSLDKYHNSQRPNNKGDIMGTSLALLPMLGAGQTPEHGRYKQNVAAGLAWLINNQESNGDLRAGFTGQAGMYAHGQATIVLCEALAMTGDQRLHNPAQRAIKFIELAQHNKGGWRYRPGEAGDTSVVGWQLMALYSAQAQHLNLHVDPSTLRLADYFLDSVTAPAKFNDRNKTPLPDGAAYCYQKGRQATPTMTAEAILCRMYLGWTRQDPRLTSAIKWLINDHLPDEKNKNLYYWYYGTQVMHHYGGKPWKIWNDRMRELLISAQDTKGRHPGSWNPKGYQWGNRGGRIYTTSLAICTLEVYYRHLPLFKQIDLDE